MTTVEQARALALTLPDAEEASHMGHADFRVAGESSRRCRGRGA